MIGKIAIILLSISTMLLGITQIFQQKNIQELQKDKKGEIKIDGKKVSKAINKTITKTITNSAYNPFNIVEIKEQDSKGEIFLDGIKVKGMTGYDLKRSTEEVDCANLTINISIPLKYLRTLGS